MALAFCYTQWRVASTIIGVTSLQQLDEDLDIWGTRLSPEVLAAIDAHPLGNALTRRYEK
jgi:aryl-alcohol dehydrogenase-like predicted oxidoreductase